MTNLEKNAKLDTKGMIFTVLLYGIGAASVPYEWLANLLGGSPETTWIIAFITKTLCAILPIYLFFQLGFERLLKLDGCKIKGLIWVLPCFLIMLNNFPFVPLIMGDMSINATFLKFLAYCLYCLSIGIIEETVFRGLILPLFLFKFSRDKKGIFFSIVASSLVFGLVHLVNLLGGFNPAVFLQVGYSFLIGAVCGFALIVTGNIYIPILLHGIYDVGGFMFSEGLASGLLWTGANVIWTAIFSVVMAIFIVTIFKRNEFNEIFDRLNLNRIPTKGENVNESGSTKGE